MNSYTNKKTEEPIMRIQKHLQLKSQYFISLVHNALEYIGIESTPNIYIAGGCFVTKPFNDIDVFLHVILKF